MARVVGVVGASGSGKTALASALVQSLRAAGVSVGYLEHAHAGFTVDRPDSDSDRLRAAGADPVVVVGPDEMFTREGPPTGLDGALTRFAHCDLVLAEGFHQASWPKILVTRDGGERRDATDPVLAEVRTDDSGGHTTDDVESLTALLVEQSRARDTTGRITLRVDGEDVPLAGFAGEIIAGTVLGMVGTLKGVDGPATVELTLAPEDPEGDFRP